MKIKIRPVIALKEHSDIMVAVMLPKRLQDVLSVSKDSFAKGSKFVPKSEYHITLAYFGDATDISEKQLSKVKSVISKIAADTAPFWVYLGGIGRFSNVEDGEYDAVYVKVRSSGVKRLHKSIINELSKIHSNWEWDYGDYIPHMTLAYVPPGSEDTAEASETEVLIDNITLAIAGKYVNYMLSGDTKTVIKQVLTFPQV